MKLFRRSRDTKNYCVYCVDGVHGMPLLNRKECDDDCHPRGLRALLLEPRGRVKN